MLLTLFWKFLNSVNSDSDKIRNSQFSLCREENMVNWSISDNLDKTVRDYLSQIGQENNISGFIEKIVQEKLFELQVEQIKQRNQIIEQTEILAAIDAALLNYGSDHYFSV